MSFKTVEELGLSEEFCMKCSNISEVKAIWSFFQRFEKDSNPADLSVADESYFNSFLFCDPDNADTVKKEDFLRFLPTMTVRYNKLGFKQKEVNGIKVICLDENYLLVQVNWKMRFLKNEQVREYDDIKATYILKNEENRYKIILQLDHQNLGDIV